MSQSVQSESAKVGLPPGTLLHIGEKKAEAVQLTLIEYTSSEFNERKFGKVDECLNLIDSGKNSWLNVDGLHNVEIIGKIGKKFNLHPLLLEDILNTQHRPKWESFDDEYMLLTLKMLGVNEDQSEIISEQISLVLGENFVISFQEQEGDVFQPLRTRLSEGKGNARNRKIDYLFYRLIDMIVDNYYYVIEFISDKVEDLEDKILDGNTESILSKIQEYKRQLFYLRRTITPLREAINTLKKEDIHLIEEKTIHYLNDVQEHLTQHYESIETQREMLSSLFDLYLSETGNRSNQVMQFLTIIATIFIPLTFIAGVYGMNFDYMPELSWEYGYFAIWSVMTIVAVIMIFYFRRKRWL